MSSSDDDTREKIVATSQPAASWPGDWPLPPPWQVADAFIANHGEAAVSWANWYLITAAQQQQPQIVAYLYNVLAVLLEMSRIAGPGEAVH